MVTTWKVAENGLRRQARRIGEMHDDLGAVPG
jgi:hypothetical protein